MLTLILTLALTLALILTFARPGPLSDDMQPDASAGCSGGWLEMLNQSVANLQEG